MEKLYENIKHRRKELGMTQQELALGMGYKDRTAVVRMEQGKDDLPYSRILRAAEILDTDPIDLMGLDATGKIANVLANVAETLQKETHK